MIEMLFAAHSGERILYAPKGDTFNVRPLGFTELAAAISTEKPVFDIEFDDVEIRESSLGHAPGDLVNLKKSFTHKGRVEVFGLVLGGWLPLPWAHKQVAWVDRNIVRAIAKTVGTNFRLPWADAGVGLGQDVNRISAVLYAIEGGLQRTQTFDEMNASLDEGTGILKTVLPTWQVEELSDLMRRALFQELERLHEIAARSEELLSFAAPLVVQPVRATKRRFIEGQILKKARDTKASNLVVFALLSCLYDNTPSRPTHKASTPGRAILKPSQLLEAEGRYNALADLLHIELMLGAIAAIPNYQPVLYTRDVGLAAFWTALAPRDPSTGPASAQGLVAPRWNLSLSPMLLPALTARECSDLVRRLEGM